MPSTTRRALLATVATGTVGSVAGCQSLTDDRASLGRPSVTGLTGATLWLDDDVSLPSAVDAETTDTRTDADVAVFPAADASVDPAIETLAADVPVAVAGDDALATLLAICRGADRSYGFTSNGWNSSTDVAGAVPRFEALHTHVFVTADYPDDLPWALGDMLQPATHEPAVPIEHVPLPENARSLGTARVRGYNAVGEFDRRDRVFVRPDSDPMPVFAEMEATIVAGRVGGPTGPYRADRVKTVADFDQRFTDVGPAARTTDALDVRNVSDPTEQLASVEFSPRNGPARESFTACQRARLAVDDLSTPFRYTGNARFRWADPQLLEDETFLHHTPGSAAWYPR